MASLLSLLIESAYPDAADRDAAATAGPFRTLRLIGLIHTVIEYGKQLIVSARQRAGTADFLAFAKPFGTVSLKLLIARIGCAVSRAVHLQQRLQYEAGLGGCYNPRAPRPAPADRAPRGRPAASTRSHAKRAARSIDSTLAKLPSVAQIAAEIRTRPIEQVIASICCDLGITPDHALWQQLDQALLAFGVRLSVAPAEFELLTQRARNPDPAADVPRIDVPLTRAPAAQAPPAHRPAVPRAQSPRRTGPPVTAHRSLAA